VTKTRHAYTGDKGCWLFCYLPVKIRMPSYLLFIYLMEGFFFSSPPAVKPRNFVAVYFCQEFMGFFLSFAGRSAFMFVTRCFCFCFKCLWSYQAILPISWM